MPFWVSQSKDRAYVVNVVTWFRRQLDGALAARGWARSSSGQSSVEFEPDVARTFNRGFTTYFLHGRGEPPGALDSPKMVGELLGAVLAVQAGSFMLDTAVALHAGDGLCWFGAGNELEGTLVNAATPAASGSQGLHITPARMAGISPGLQVYRNHDHAFLRQVESSHPRRAIGVGLRLEATAGGFCLQAIDEDGNVAEVTTGEEPVPAQKPAQAEATARKQLSRMGDTPFACTGVAMAWDRPYFLPMAALNGLRRDVLAKLAAVRAANRPVMSGEIRRTAVPYPEERLSFRGNALNRQAVAFYRRHGVLEIAPAAESGLDMQGQVVMRTRYCLKHQLGLCDGQRSRGDIQEPLYLVDEDGHRYRLRFDCRACEMEVFY